jgi:hypothetical protein
MSRLNMIDAIRETLPYVRNIYHNEMDSAYLSGHEAGSRYAWERAGMDGNPPGWAPLGEDAESTDAEDFSTRLVSPRRGGTTSRKRSGSPGSFRFNILQHRASRNQPHARVACNELDGA